MTDSVTSVGHSSISVAALRIGGHGESDDPLREAQARHANAAQFFLGDPQGWKAPTTAYPGGAQALARDAATADIALYVHAPYVLNVATTNNRIRIPSRKLLQQQLDLAAQVGARGVIVHGGHVLKSDDPGEGIANWVKTVERLTTPVPLLLENTAGGDNAMARRKDRITQLWDAVAPAAEKAGNTVGICLDTCHAHAAGWDFATLVDDLLAITGRIDLLHANDSRDGFDSGADRHANLGQGQIDSAALHQALRHAFRLTGCAVIVETPGGAAGQQEDIAYIREVLERE